MLNYFYLKKKIYNKIKIKNYLLIMPLTNYDYQKKWRIKNKEKHKQVNLKYRMRYYYWDKAVKELLNIDKNYFLD